METIIQIGLSLLAIGFICLLFAVVKDKIKDNDRSYINNNMDDDYNSGNWVDGIAKMESKYQKEQEKK